MNPKELYLSDHAYHQTPSKCFVYSLKILCFSTCFSKACLFQYQTLVTGQKNWSSLQYLSPRIHTNMEKAYSDATMCLDFHVKDMQIVFQKQM